MSATVKLKQLLYDSTMPSAPQLVIREENDRVRCLACGHRCAILPGRHGVCRVRFNSGGELRAPAGYVAGLQVDPIEKKPFYHAYPGREALSFGMLGCDFHCSYCQNWVTSQALRDDRAIAPPHYARPDRLIALALEHNAPVIVSTYNEPLITADWAVEIFKLAQAEGLRCAFVSNGNATPEVLEFIRPYVDLYKVDLKSFNDRSYRELGGVLDNVLATIGLLYEMEFWVEIVTLVVPGFNDSPEELREIAEFLAGVSTDIPWHVTAFRPDYKMTEPGRTPTETLVMAYEIGREAGLKFVYPGNVHGGVGDRENTFCPCCGELLIQRHGFMVMSNRMQGRACPSCAATIPGVWEDAPPKSSRGPGFPRAVSVRATP